MNRLEKSREDFSLPASSQWREGRIRVKGQPKEEHETNPWNFSLCFGLTSDAGGVQGRAGGSVLEHLQGRGKALPSDSQQGTVAHTSLVWYLGYPKGDRGVSAGSSSPADAPGSLDHHHLC